MKFKTSKVNLMFRQFIIPCYYFNPLFYICSLIDLLGNVIVGLGVLICFIAHKLYGKKPLMLDDKED